MIITNYIQGRVTEPSTWAAVAAAAVGVAFFTGIDWILIAGVAAGLVGIFLGERKR
jgi:predicted branched-subunit amino acid permease|tara:strand:- start:205 stop:372 length:168 start_codon:yes stop_codon:yes gene_type:complete